MVNRDHLQPDRPYVSALRPDEAVVRELFEHMGGKGKVALLQGDKAHQAGALREEGVREALAEFPGIELAGYAEAKWARDTGERTANNLLTQAPDLNAIIALNDEMAHGALAAVQARGMNVLVTGYNGQCDAIKAVLGGQMAATLYQPFRDIGAKVVEVAVEVANKKPVEAKINMPAVPLDSDFAAALLEITRKRMGMVAVVDGDRHVQGIFTDGDLRRVLGRAGSLDPATLRIRDVMTASPVTIAPGALAVEAVRIMEERKIGQILVVGPDKVLMGALHFHDLLVAKVV